MTLLDRNGLTTILVLQVECFMRSEADQLLILASDGLWDVMSNSDVANHALRKFQKYHAAGHSTQSSLRHVASSLAKTAISKGSRDNITVLVVDARLKVKESPSLIQKTPIDESKFGSK